MSDILINHVNEEVSHEQPGFLKRLLWVLTSPGKLMENLAERPRVLFGLILSALAMVLLFVIRMPLYEDILRSSMSLTGQTMTAEMIEQSLPLTKIAGLVTVPLTMVFVILFYTVIFFAILKLIGGQGRFKAYLSVTCYSYVVPALYTLLLIPVSFVTGSLHQDIPLSSLATLASTDMRGTFLFGILKGLDIFAIWYYAVMAIGFTAVSKLKKTYVYGVAAVIFLIGLIIAGVGETSMKAFM